MNEGVSYHSKAYKNPFTMEFQPMTEAEEKAYKQAYGRLLRAKLKCLRRITKRKK